MSGNGAQPTWDTRRVIEAGVATGVALWALATAFLAVRAFLFLLLLAWLLSIAIEPLVLWLLGHGVGRRGVATGIALGSLLLLGMGLVALLGQLVAVQVADLAEHLPETVRGGIEWVNRVFGTQLDPNSGADIHLDANTLRDAAGRYGSGLLGVFGSLAAALFDGLTILVFAYYLSADSPRLRQSIGSWLPRRQQLVVITVWEVAVEKTGGYVLSKAILAMISAFAHAVAFWVIGVPFWLALGLLAGVIGQLVPVVGTYIGIVIPALFTLGAKPINALWVVLFAAVYQQIENYVLSPRVSRRTMDLHPALALGAVFVGVTLFGWVGALIGIPLAAAALALVETFRNRYDLLPALASLDEESPSSAP